MQAEGVALFFSKCGALVEPGIQQQIEAGQAGANHGVAAMGETGEFCSLKACFSLLFLYDRQIPWRQC